MSSISLTITNEIIV